MFDIEWESLRFCINGIVKVSIRRMPALIDGIWSGNDD